MKFLIKRKRERESKAFRIYFHLRLIEELVIDQNRERSHKQSPLKETLLIDA
jgi:hypothetical protein